MSIKIHHGPDGTYKTSGAIKDDILNVIKSGRLLVTNVRGFSKELCHQVLKPDEIHADFDVIFVDTDTSEGRLHFAKFFHWAPKGAFFVIDEVQRIFPAKWTATQLKTLDYPHNQDHLPEEQRRPEDIQTAFDMQRHHNWDFIFTTTNIKKVHEIMRVMAKVAVRHVNLGLWRFYKTVEHDAESNGKTGASGTIRYFQYVPSRVFKLYQSTTTGSFDNTEPRTAFYKDPKIMGLLLILVGFWAYILYKPLPKAVGGGKQTTEQIAQSDKTATEMGSKKNTAKNSDISERDVGTKQSSNTDTVTMAVRAYIEFYDSIYINGSDLNNNTKVLTFEAYKDGEEYAFNSFDLKELGINVFYISQCLARIKYHTIEQYLTCKPQKIPSPVSADDKFQFRAGSE